MKIRFLIFSFLILAFSLSGKQKLVTSASQINGITWLPGDTLVMTNGTWMDQSILLKSSGNATQPIVLKAQTPGQVILSGTSHIGISGNYLEVNGLFFKNGNLSTSEIISFRTSSSEFAYNCRVTNCAIRDSNPADSTVDSKWVSLYGANNKVDHCSFQNKSNMGTLLVVWLQAGIVPNHIIDQNYFGYRNSILDANGAELNGQEIMRLGDSSTSMQTAGVQVTNNFFEHCNGEIETISNKSCNNYFSNNVFFECKGMLTLRHGNFATVEGNYFFGNGVSDSGGVRIIGENHKVYNNYFDNLRGTDYRAAICIVRGKLNSLPNEYFQVKNATVEFNTFVNCTQAFKINYNSSSSLTMPPIGTVIAHNHVYNTSSSNTNVNIDQTNSTGMDVSWKNNLMNQGKYTNFSYNSSQVIPGQDAKMTLAGTTITMYEPGTGSALANYTTTENADVISDIRGRDRGTAKLPGASQLSGTVTRTMPNRTTVGASFFNGQFSDIKPIPVNTNFTSFVLNKKLIINSIMSGKLSIYDTLGKNILQQNLTEETSSCNLPAKGIYILSFFASNGDHVSRKIIVD